MPRLLWFLLAAALAGCAATRTIFSLADQDVTPQPAPGAQRIHFEFPLIIAPDGTTYTETELITFLVEPLTRLPESSGHVTVKPMGPAEFDLLDVYASAPPTTGSVPFLPTAKTEYHIDETIRLRVTPNADRTQFIITADPRASRLLEYREEVYSDGTRHRLDGLGDESALTRPDSPRFRTGVTLRKEPLSAKVAKAAREAQAGQIRWPAKAVSHSRNYELPWPMERVATAVVNTFPNATSLTDTPGARTGQFSSAGTTVGFSVTPTSSTGSVLSLSLPSNPQWELAFESRKVQCLGCPAGLTETLDPAAAKITRAVELLAPPVIAAPPVPAVPRAPERRCVMVSPGNANLRELPLAKSTLLKKLAKGTVALQLAIDAEWMKIELRGGLRGWVHRSLIEPTPCS